MRLRVLKFVFDLGGVVIAFAVAFLYIVQLFNSDLSKFIQIAGPVFAGIATLCGLALGFASVIETPADKTSVANSAEKLLHSTLFLFTTVPFRF
jgi:Na+/melibiose symporter-like transporter